MWIPLLAVTTVAISLATAVALALVVVLFFRQQKQLEALRTEMKRVARVQKEGTADVRARLDVQNQTVTALGDELKPAMEAATSAVGDLEMRVAPSLDGLKTEFESLMGQLGALGKRVSEVEQRGSSTQAGVESVREEWSRIQAMVDKSERQLARFDEDREAEEARLADLRGAVGALRGTVEQKIAVQEERLGKLETGPEAQLAAAAEGLDLASPSDVGAPTQTGTDATSPQPTAEAAGTEEDAASARWIFFVMFVLLGLALVARYLG